MKRLENSTPIIIYTHLWLLFFLFFADDERRAEVLGFRPPVGFLSVLAFAILSCYLPCSRASVTVVWSQTSLGPKYWMGPGYT